jgi:hypothetical protein
MRKELEYRYSEDGTMRYIKILMLFTEYPEVQVKAAVSLCVRRRALSEEAFLNVIRNEPLPQRSWPSSHKSTLSTSFVIQISNEKGGNRR